MEGGGLINPVSLPSSHGAMHLGWEGDEKVPLALLDNPLTNKLVEKTTSAICKTTPPRGKIHPGLDSLDPLQSFYSVLSSNKS